VISGPRLGLYAGNQPLSSLPLPAEIERFDFDAVNKAPQSPGVYAWYAKLSAGLADYRRDMAPDWKTDLGEKNLRRLLLLHSRKFNPVPYDLLARSSFELTWTGKLEPQLAASLDRILNEHGIDELEDEERTKAERVQVPFRREKTRSILVGLIERATPFLTAPIYIGTSDDLRRRLDEHTTRINQFANALEAEPEKREVLLQHIRTKASNFAARVTALELAPEQLEVYTLDVKRMAAGHNVSTDELEALAAALEWLLNRWHRPLAGRI
jgi:hypothetical protein